MLDALEGETTLDRLYSNDQTAEWKAHLGDLAGTCTAVAIGPGLGRSAALADVLLLVLSQTTVPLVIDADALNALEGRTTDLRVHHGPVVITQ